MYFQVTLVLAVPQHQDGANHSCDLWTALEANKTNYCFRAEVLWINLCVTVTVDGSTPDQN